MAKEMKGLTYCGECIYYNKKKNRCTVGASMETDPRRTFYDDCPLPEVAPVQKWIPVTERLPEPGKEVLVYEGYISIDWISPGGNWATDDVTHWMPLPEPPKEE